jgi:hypothetical protein
MRAGVGDDDMSGDEDFDEEDELGHFPISCTARVHIFKACVSFLYKNFVF